MQRILDLDLDAFVYGSEHLRSRDAPRLDPAEHPPWELSKVVDFLESKCLLRGPLPGFELSITASSFSGGETRSAGASSGRYFTSRTWTHMPIRDSGTAATSTS